MAFHRYVAIGDSSTEGIDDPLADGRYRGWADRLAQHVANAQGSLLYANLGVRGLRTRQVRDQQLEPALAMHPDLVTLFTGTNDVVAFRFDAGGVAADLQAMQHALVAQGATVLTFTLPDIAPVMPMARFLSPRIRRLNDVIRTSCARTGAVLVDMAAHPVGSDARLWSDDRFHANSIGHERIAAALAHAIALPGMDDTWSQPLPTEPRRSIHQVIGAELVWTRDYLLPWVMRVARGRSSGDGRGPKRPTLTPVEG